MRTPTRSVLARTAGVLLVLAAAAAAGCGDSSTPGDAARLPDLGAAPDTSTGVSDGGASDLPKSCPANLVLGPQAPNVSAACTACAQAKCCDALSACAADPDCAGFRGCVAACNGPCSSDAQKACETKYPKGLTASDTVASCRNTSCGAECANWSCAGKVVLPAPSKPMYTFVLTLVDYQTMKPVAGATVKTCPLADNACASPLTAPATTDDKGQTTITAPSTKLGIDAYLEVTAGGYVPQLFYPQGYDVAFAFGKDEPGRLTAYSFATGTFQLVGNLLGAMPRSDHGHIAFNATDCAHYGGAGVVAKVSNGDADTRAYYVAGTLPSKSATATDASGAGLVINVPPGLVTFTLSTAAGMTQVASEAVQVRAGAITSFGLFPTP